MNGKKDRIWSRDFFLIWQGQLVSTMGDAAYSIALGFWVLQTTGSTALMGTLMAVSAIPGILVSPFAGVWIDRVSRKPLLILMDILRGISMLLIAYAAYTQKIAVWMVFAAGILLSVCGAVFRPGVNSSIPQMVSQQRLSNANSALSLASTGSGMIGNIAGGFFFQLLGAPLLFLLNGISYFFSGSSLLFVRLPQRRSEITSDFWGDMRSGFQFMWKQKGLRYLLSITALINFFSYVAIVLFLPLFQKTPDLGAGRYGIVMAGFMGGAMTGYLISSVMVIPARKRLILFAVSNIVSNISFVFAVNQRIFWLMFILVFVGGFFNSMLNVILLSAVQAAAPTEMRGKVMAFLNMSTQSLTPVAMALGGVLAAIFPIRAVISASFLIIVLFITPFSFIKCISGAICYGDNSQDNLSEQL